MFIVDTVRRTYHNEELNARTRRRTPLLKPHHKKSCLQYAKTLPPSFCARRIADP